MQQTSETDFDNTCMYRFRTYFCTKKKCQNPSKCFGAHSPVMRRRVPSLREDGLFNYIPKLCPQWGNSMRCDKGDKCHLSHGWLEIIFHPLLYKTKICKSTRRNGICRQYGVYCAKAHKSWEIRNLVKIYGENWKKHYNLSLRDQDATTPVLTNRYSSSKSNSARFSKWHSNEVFISDCETDRRNIATTQWSEQNKGEGNPNTSSQFYSPTMDVNKSGNSPFFFTSSPLFGGYTSIGDVKTNRTLDEEITSYVQLYSENENMSESKNSDLSFSCKFIDPEVRSDRTCNLTEDVFPLKEFTTSCSINSDLMSPFLETWKLSETLDVDWKKKSCSPTVQAEPTVG
jgi:hypothetical protein